MARLIYGFRISRAVRPDRWPAISSVVGIAAGAIQGYFGGWIDLVCAALHRNLVVAAAALSAHHHLVDHHAELLRAARHSARCFPGSIWSMSCAPNSCARAISNMCTRRARSASPTARSSGKHVLPNAMVATLTFLPFVLNSSITTLTSLDFLGFGLPPGSPSLGELLLQGKSNLAGALARPHRLRRHRAHAVAARLHRRGRARRLRSEEDASIGAW